MDGDPRTRRSGARNPAAETLPLASVALVSGAALGYEVLLLRVFSISQWHHFAHMIISLALLGFGASGTVLALARPWFMRRYRSAYPAAIALFSVTSLIGYLGVRQIPLHPDELLWTPGGFLRLTTVYLLLAVPFLFAAGAIGLALSRHGSRAASLYGADLLGAGTGSLAVVIALWIAPPADVLKLVAAAALGAVAAALWEIRAARRIPGMVLVLAGAVVLMPASWLAPGMSPYKPLSQVLQIPGTRVIEERSSPLGLLSVVESPKVPFRHAPGLSLRAEAGPPGQLAVFTDGGGMSVLTRFTGDPEPLGYLDQTTAALPYHLAQPRSVLILGAGTGEDVLLAWFHGVPRIDAVEPNPQMIQLVRERFAAFVGDLYRLPVVNPQIADARRVLAASRRTHDLIQFPSQGGPDSALRALDTTYQTTLEALGAALDALTPGGSLALTREVRIPPRDMLKLAATALMALRQRGIRDPAKHLILVRSWQTATLVIQRPAFTRAQIDAAERFSRERVFDLAWYPGMQRSEANRYNRLREPLYYDALLALSGDNPAAYMDRYKFHLEPPTDDRPYGKRFFRWTSLPEILELRGRGGTALLESGYLVLVATLIQALFASALLILLPLIGCRKRKRADPGGAPRAGGYFLLLGLGFLFVEIAFIQRLTLYLGNPLYAVTVALTGFLVFAGIGSLLSARATNRFGAVRTVQAAIALLAILAGLQWAAGPAVGSVLFALPLWAAMALAALLVAPLGLAMGVPFPVGIARLSRHAPHLIPWAWAINGCASVVGAVLATLIAIHFGFHTLMLAALLLYGLAAGCVPGRRGEPSGARRT